MLSLINRPSKTIILLSGWMQSGKDTVGEVLVTKYDFKRYAYADALKDELSNLLQIDRQLFDTIEGKNKLLQGKTIRQHLIDYGQARRKSDSLYWVKIVCKLITQEHNSRIVITDCRMLNEIEHIIETFGKNQVICCRINRWKEPPLKDETEMALDDFPFDIVIDNDNDTVTFHEKIIKTFDNIL